MKFSTEDERYFRLRRAYSEKIGHREMWSILDQWPLYVGIGNLERCMAIADLLRSTLDVPGHLAEFGSWHGSNLMFIAKLMKIYDPRCSKVTHCFDSFEGLVNFSTEDGEEAVASKGAYVGHYEEFLEMVDLYELQDDIDIHKGLIQDTLLPLLKENRALTFSFIYCDTDLFEPTELILNSLHERLSKDGLFVFDQWNSKEWQGEGRAANKFLQKYCDVYDVVHVRNARQPTMAIRKKSL